MANSYAPQTNYGFYVSFFWDYGLVGLPVAGPPGTPLEVVSDAAPMCYKNVNWMAQAIDSADPQPPDWDTGNANEVLVQKAISSTFLTDMGDGTTANTIAGVYIYLLKVPPSDTDALQIGAPPWDSSLLNILYPSTFLQDLLQGTPVSQAGTYGGRQGQVLLQKPLG